MKQLTLKNTLLLSFSVFCLQTSFAQDLIEVVDSREQISFADIAGTESGTGCADREHAVVLKLEPYVLDKNAQKYIDLLDSSKIKGTLETLASDAFDGRKTGSVGGVKTQDYIAEHLKKSNVTSAIKGNYFQSIGYYNQSKGRRQFVLNNFDFVDSSIYSNKANRDSVIVADTIIFVGYGCYSPTMNEYANLDIKNKIIMKIEGEPKTSQGISYALNNKHKDFLAQEQPKAILEVSNGFRDYSSYVYGGLYNGEREDIDGYEGIPSVEINELLANMILASTNKTLKQVQYEMEVTGKPQSAIIPSSVKIVGKYKYEDARAYNVIGFVEGKDLKDEYIVVSAHHDHLGKNYSDEVYNGADDNASGVSAVLEMARVMAQAKKEGKGPRRSIIFLFPTGEEDGLYGSEYYVKHPIFPLDKTIACLNLDMLGRIDDRYNDDNNNYVFIANHKTESAELVSRLKNVNSTTSKMNLDFALTFPGDSNYTFTRSDQYNFHKKDIPSIMFTSGMHADYHKVTDDANRIDYDGLHKRVKLVFTFLWDLANNKD